MAIYVKIGACMTMIIKDAELLRSAEQSVPFMLVASAKRDDNSLSEPLCD